MGTVADKLNKVLNTKKAIKQALIDKGVEVKDTDTFASYPDKITEIQTGGGGDMWEQIGYKAPPKFIDDGVKYAKEIYYNWDASITNRNRTFYGDIQLVYFPLVDTSNITSMSMMFYNCSNLQCVPAIDISKVTLMNSLFSDCTSLISLDLSHFNTSNVTNMSSMFYNCNKLTSLDLSSFDTSKVTNMYGMFDNCTKLTSLDISNFDTSNVTDMGNMFGSCSGLTSLDLSSFDTSNVTNMQFMFKYCTNLTSLDLSSFDTSNVTNMNYMFQTCNNLKRIDGYIDWSKISSYPSTFFSTFYGYYNLRYMVIKNIGKTGTTFNFNSDNIQNWGDNTEEIPDARQSLVDTFVNYTYDRVSNGMGSCTIQLYSKIKARLTNDEIAQITAKGFTVT